MNVKSKRNQRNSKRTNIISKKTNEIYSPLTGNNKLWIYSHLNGNTKFEIDLFNDCF